MFRHLDLQLVQVSLCDDATRQCTSGRAKLQVAWRIVQQVPHPLSLVRRNNRFVQERYHLLLRMVLVTKAHLFSQAGLIAKMLVEMRHFHHSHAAFVRQQEHPVVRELQRQRQPHGWRLFSVSLARRICFCYQ